MEAPPQFPGAPKKSKTGLILGLVALGIVLCCCGICGGGAYFGRGVIGKTFSMAGCGMAIGLQRNALAAYANAHGGKLPSATTWQDDIKPYVAKIEGQGEKGQPFTIPTVMDDFCDKDSGTSIVYNTALAGKKFESVKDPYETIALFEAPGKGRNKSAAYKEQPFTSSPILVSNERRGWIRVPLKGEASTRDKRGQVVPIKGMSASSTPGVEVISKDSSAE